MKQKFPVSSQGSDILLVEDQASDRERIELFLKDNNFRVYVASTAAQGFEIFSQMRFGLVIIHIGHPPNAGLLLSEKIRADSTIPILMLTKRNEVLTEDMALQAGADDYVTKPINLKILAARIKHQLGRNQAGDLVKNDILTWGPLSMDLNQHTFTVDNKTVHLTVTEFQMLELLMRNPQQVFSRGQILEVIGAISGMGSNRVLDTHISRLRKKIRDNGGPVVPAVVRTVGYRLGAPVSNII